MCLLLKRDRLLNRWSGYGPGELNGGRQASFSWDIQPQAGCFEPEKRCMRPSFPLGSSPPFDACHPFLPGKPLLLDRPGFQAPQKDVKQMNRIRFGKLLVMVSILLLVFTSLSFGATKVGELLDDDSGDVFELWDNEDGTFTVIVHREDGTGSVFEIGQRGNPSPDDPDGSVAAPDLEDWIRKHYKGKLEKGVQTDNPLSLKRSGQGKGLAPRWNPPEAIRDAGGTGGTDGTPKDAGWIKDQARRGTGGEDEDDQGSSGKNERPGIGETGSVQPERVNPVPFLKAPTADVHSMEGWQPPADDVAPPQGGAAPVETPTQTVTPTPGKTADQTPSLNPAPGTSSTPPIRRTPTLTPTLNTPSAGRVQRVQP